MLKECNAFTKTFLNKSLFHLECYNYFCTFVSKYCEPRIIENILLCIDSTLIDQEKELNEQIERIVLFFFDSHLCSFIKSNLEKNNLCIDMLIVLFRLLKGYKHKNQVLDNKVGFLKTIIGEFKQIYIAKLTKLDPLQIHKILDLLITVALVNKCNEFCGIAFSDDEINAIKKFSPSDKDDISKNLIVQFITIFSTPKEQIDEKKKVHT